MLKGVVVQGSAWGQSLATCSSLKGFYCITSDMPVEERLGEGPNHMSSDMEGQVLN